MKSRVENGDLRQTRAECLAGGGNAFDVRRIMQRRKLDAVFDAAQNFVGNQCRFGKFFAAVNDSMPDGVNIGKAFDFVNSRLVRSNPPDNRFNRRFYIPNGRGEKGKGLALELTAWSGDLVLCTNGASELGAEDLERLKKNNIAVREEPITRLEGTGGILERIVFASGESLPRRAMFFSTGHRQRSDLAERLGCKFTDKGAVETGEYEATGIRGLYAAGDASRHVQSVVVAASEGAEAAFAINTALLKQDLK